MIAKNSVISLAFAVASSLLALSGCDKPEVANDVALPTNLSTNIVVEEGKVTVQASADAVNFFTFAFFEGDDTVLIESATGEAEYTYSATGSYTIRTRAHAIQTAFIEVNDVVDIELEEVIPGQIPTTGYTTPMSYPGYILVWNDEFDGTELSSDWVFDIGTGSSGWGNNELQYYTDENVEVAGGYLIITAKEENFDSQEYTSSRVKTQGRKSFEKGRIDIRAALPFGKGIWPALWMLGDNITSVGWPACGEIDIVELVGGNGAPDRTVHGTIHWDDFGHVYYGNSNSLPSGRFADEFHVFSIIWDETSIRWLRDDIQYNEADITPAALSEFHNNFFFIMNIAVGGNWPGSPDATTVFPQIMAVDYIRVFQ
jgi:beta-glucanase (GH16 family)